MSLRVEMVRQEHAKGCGVASIAMLTGATYDKALAVVRDFHGAYDPATEGMVATRLVGPLQRAGLFVRSVMRREDFGCWPPPPFADAHIAEVKNPGGGHFVVMLADGRIFDPLDGTTHKRLSDWKAVYCVMGVRS